MFPAAAEGAGPSPGPAAPDAPPHGPVAVSGAHGPEPSGPGAAVPGPEGNPFGEILEPAAALPIRPLSFRELLDLPFALIQSRVRLLAGMVGAAFVVSAGSVVAITAAGSVLTGGSDTGTAWSAVLSTLVFAWLLRAYVRGVAVPVGLASARRRAITWRAALRGLGAHAGQVLRYRVSSTGIGLGVLIPGAALIVTLLPALALLGWARARRCLITPALLDKPMSYRDAAARAKNLAAGAEWRMAGAWLYLRAVLLVLVVPLLGVVLFVAEFSGTHRWATITLATAAALFVTAATEVVECASDVVAYLDRCCRREGLDIRIPHGAKAVRAVTS
ncbi:hypothetical protein [Nocardia mexicana]|uniref:hypothetical protein n=1 Tax=Nocardia mexicana TaxID=279262 RepID=UPI000AB1038C|nr:hypothetical protein [Nocardia mexicana]